MQASTSLAFSTPRKSCRSTLKCHPGKLGTTVASVPPLPFEFPADHPPAPRASARHAVVISVLPQSTVIYTCCPRDPSKQRCFRFNSDRTLHNTADSGPSKRFCPLSSKNIASHTQQNGAGTNELDKCRHLSFFFFYIVPSSAKICWSYVVFLTFSRQTNQSYVHAAFVF